MHRIFAAILTTSSLCAMAAPSHADVVFKTAGVDGGIRVANDFTACGEIVFPPGTAFVGEFTAVGQVQGPGIMAGTVRGSIPIASTTGSWSGCIPGAYEGASLGDGKFTLTAHAQTDDFAQVKQCVVNGGRVTCV